MVAYFVWIVVTAVLFTALVIWRESHLHRRLRLTDIHWKAAILLAALIALVPAFLFDYYSRDRIEVPAGIAERDGVPVATPKFGE